MKLTIYDPSWPLYRPLLERFLDTPYHISSGANDLSWLRKEISDSDALLAVELPAEVRAFARGLQLVLFPGAGVMQTDTHDLPEGCRLCNVFEHEIPIAEYVLMVILMHSTRVLHYATEFRHGCWDGNGRIGGEPHQEVYGKRIGLVGYGHIGQAIAIRARALGMRVEAITRNPHSPSRAPHAAILEGLNGTDHICELFTQNDFVVIACPLNKETRGWIGSRELAHLQPHALLVNVARAEIIQEEALFLALEHGRFFAALDVWYSYPTEPGEHLPGSRFPLQQLPNVLATPHLSAWTTAMVERRMRRIAENLDHLAKGESLERVVMTGTWRTSAQQNDTRRSNSSGDLTGEQR